MICTIPFLWLYYVLKIIIGTKRADRFAYCVTKFWAHSIIVATGSKVSVIGLENISPRESVCFIANHQSFFDIPLLMGWLKRPVGFIAKQELKKVPVLSGWITAIHSAFLDRTNARKAIHSISIGINSIKAGHAIVIFPEGTRSKDGLVHDFKIGSLKLALGADAVIQPISISGTRMIYESSKRIHSSNITLCIHEAISPDDAIYADKTMLNQKLQDKIKSNCDDIARDTRDIKKVEEYGK
jgi:1-acyl-sn-glycerol-3-phosphate acyltransferase